MNEKKLEGFLLLHNIAKRKNIGTLIRQETFLSK